jgi:hypothetical protein
MSREGDFLGNGESPSIRLRSNPRELLGHCERLWKNSHTSECLVGAQAYLDWISMEDDCEEITA